MTFTAHFSDGTNSGAISADVLRPCSTDAGLIEVFNSGSDTVVAYFSRTNTDYVTVG